MNTIRQSAVMSGGEHLSIGRKHVTAPKLIRWAGLAAMAAGIIFAGIQPIHPPDFASSVSTGTWAIIETFKWVMCLFFLVGVTGIYTRQVEEAGWLGLTGFVLFGLSWFIQTGYVFVEAFMLPVLAPAAPRFVDSYLAIARGVPGDMNIGVLPSLFSVLGILYMLGGLLLGIATFRARILPRWPAALLAVTALLTPAAALLLHAVQRVVAGMPMGIAIAWLGVALFLDRRAQASQPMAGGEGARVLAPEAE